MRVRTAKDLSPRMKFFFARIFPWFFILAGSVALYFGVKLVLNARASAKWPTAAGKVVSSQIETHRSSRRHGGHSTTYHAKIRYQFLVDGKERTGTRVSYGDYGSSNRAHAEQIARQYPVGTVVTVRYAPFDPEECVLEPGQPWYTWLFPGIGALFMTVGGLMAVFLPRALRSGAPHLAGPAADPRIDF